LSIVFETKYLLPVRRASAVATWLDALCLPDPRHPRGHVRTLYLDSPHRRFLAEKTEGDFAKTKFRLRWYAPDSVATAAGVVWIEIKQKEGARRWKTRAQFQPSAAEFERTDPADARVDGVISWARDRGFDAPDTLGPSLALGYLRSRWIEPRTGTRVALDQAIQPTWVTGREPLAGTFRQLLTGVVEFKGESPDVPPLLRGLAGFGGHRASFSKYLACYANIVGDTLSYDDGDA
jgi:hypothetical protein